MDCDMPLRKIAIGESAHFLNWKVALVVFCFSIYCSRSCTVVFGVIKDSSNSISNFSSRSEESSTLANESNLRSRTILVCDFIFPGEVFENSAII